MPNEAAQNLSALQGMMAQQEQAQTSPLIEQIYEGSNIAKVGDVQRSQGLLTGIGARRRLNEQREFNQKQAIAALPAQMEAQQMQAFREQQLFDHDLRQEEIATSIAEMNLQKMQTGAPEQSEVVNTAMKLGTARDKQLQPMTDALNAYSSIKALDVQGMSPANATALIFKFVQSMDNTAVRDGERQMITGQGGPLAEFVNKWNQMSGGGALGQEAWDDMIDTASTLAESQFNAASRINDNWDKRISSYAQEFMMPALLNTTRSTIFDPTQTFEGGGSSRPAIAPPPSAATPDGPTDFDLTRN